MDEQIILFIVVGFGAQLIDGALGMAYGVSSNTFLLSLGIPPAPASASVHAAQVFTTMTSGLAHWHLGNVDRAVLKKLVVPGMVGGIIGAYILTAIPSGIIKPFVALYLLIMGLVILWRALRRKVEAQAGQTHLVPLAAVGGFMDAVGGGGWGPIVTSTLVARGSNPRLTIGTVNMAEFFVTAAESVAFIATIGLKQGHIILGLIIGGVLAAPLAAYMCRRLPAQMLMSIVGGIIIILSLRMLTQIA